MDGSSPEVSTQLLKNKYKLHNAPEVTDAANRTEARTGKEVSLDPLDRIQNYLNRFHEITDREDPQLREHGMNAIKKLLHRKYVIKPDEVPISYWENQRRIIRERGQEAELNVVNWEELKRQNTESIIADQTSSMDKWIDYLSSSDAPYPDALKYWALRSVLNMSEYDKEKKQYPQRSKGTTRPFPDLNREALAYVIDAVDKKYRATGVKKSNEDTDPEFEKLLQGENFARLYAFAIEKVTPADEQGLVNTTGHWIKYDKGSDYMPLVTSLQGHGTGWCTAGESTAQKQLEGGDFYVYYSNDPDGKPVVPRVAIRMEGSRIAEIRGIAPEQNLDQYIAPIVEKKLEEFPDRKQYQKKVADMKRLTEIDHKIQSQTSLDATDLVFLYEVDSRIEGFGYDRDPRIEELRNKRILEADIKIIYGYDLKNPDKETLEFIYDIGKKRTPSPFIEYVHEYSSQRDVEADMAIIFGCETSQIAHSLEELRPDTKAYIGPLVPGIFYRLQEHKIEHVYTSFPEGKIRRQDIMIGGKTKEQLQTALEEAGITVSIDTIRMMKKPAFTTFPVTHMLDTVRLKFDDLGLSESATAEELYKKAQELGLSLCPPEVGPHYRLQYMDQPIGEELCIGMEPIPSQLDVPTVFHMERFKDGLWLRDALVHFQGNWEPDKVFVFCLSKSETQSTNS